ncbi:MAG: hypothetical protein ACUZ77_04240 [Candidatus Brocadiales bacterium]
MDKKGRLNKMKILKLFLMFSCVFVLSAVVFYPTYANPKVWSSKQKSSGKCKKKNTFGTASNVFVKGKGLRPRSNYDIYVTSNKIWTGGEELIDLSMDGVETVTTDDEGKFCEKIWGNPLIDGTYDIVVDCLWDGTIGEFDVGIDYVDNNKNNKPGFKVNVSVPKVRSAIKGKCEGRDEFTAGDDIRAKAKGFPSHTTVDVYVVVDKDWTGGEAIGPDVRSSGIPNMKTTNGNGRLKCVNLGGVAKGAFDIVVDVNMNGTFDPGVDAVDGKRGHGFRVK